MKLIKLLAWVERISKMPEGPDREAQAMRLFNTANSRIARVFIREIEWTAQTKWMPHHMEWITTLTGRGSATKFFEHAVRGSHTRHCAALVHLQALIFLIDKSQKKLSPSDMICGNLQTAEGMNPKAN